MDEEQQIRAAALLAAASLFNRGGNPSPSLIIDRAKEFEGYIRSGTA
jgi:hypothetical protein